MVTTNKKGLTPPLSPASASGLSNDHDLAKISPAYLQELQETFNLFDTERKGVLSMEKLRLAMRTLGFEASLEDIEEIIQDMPDLSVNLAKRKKNRQQGKKGKDKKKSNDSTSKVQDEAASGTSGTRRSSRNAAITSRTASKSKYVDSDGVGSSEEDDDDDYGSERDIYKDNCDETNNNDTEPYFTLRDFITIMTPDEATTELGISMKDEELREMIEEADRDGDGAVTEQEFAKIMKKTGF
ncbi:hypothetical protein BGZ76_008777 [Entomortierella beljakovae]|nr:hypothetical protein BGZ76_008777 [Entomortierella beljakovae]